MTQLPLATPSPTDGMSQRVEREVGLTPTPVVRQGLRWAQRMMWKIRGQSIRILDPSAGTGVFGKVWRELWPDAYIVGIEPRNDAADVARRHYDKMIVADLEAVDLQELGHFHLCSTNPPFSLAYGWLANLLRHCDLVVYLHKSAWPTDSDKVDPWARRFPPVREARVSGRINFFGPGINPKNGKKWGTDSSVYSWWAMRQDCGEFDRAEIEWPCTRLPLLPAADRRWTVPPGTEDE